MNLKTFIWTNNQKMCCESLVEKLSRGIHCFHKCFLIHILSQCWRFLLLSKLVKVFFCFVAFSYKLKLLQFISLSFSDPFPTGLFHVIIHAFSIFYFLCCMWWWFFPIRLWGWGGVIVPIWALIGGGNNIKAKWMVTACRGSIIYVFDFLLNLEICGI